jgi:hypothetical protein
LVPVECSLILLTFLLIGSAAVLGQGKTVTVTGRAVDERGAPISNAIATLYYPPCRDCIDHILPVGFSFPDGVFFVQHAGVSLRGWKLFLRERVPNGYWSPIDGPPFEKLSHLARFKGIPIRPRKVRVRVDLGDVLVKVRYSKVVIELPSVLGEKYKPSRDALNELNFTLRDAQAKIIYDGQLPELAFDPTFSFVNLALTKGAWRVEFSCSNQKVRLRSPVLPIHIADLGCKKVTVVHGRQTEQTCH